MSAFYFFELFSGGEERAVEEKSTGPASFSSLPIDHTGLVPRWLEADRDLRSLCDLFLIAGLTSHQLLQCDRGANRTGRRRSAGNGESVGGRLD